MDVLLVILRLVHIVCGAVWVGIVTFMTLYLGPAVQDAGPEGGRVMLALQRRGLMTALPVIALLAVVSGLWLYWRASMGLDPAWVHSAVGGTYAMGGLAALIAYVTGLTIMRPSMLRAMALSQELASVASEPERQQKTAEVQRLRARGRTAGRVVTVLLILSTAAMAVARYV